MTPPPNALGVAELAARWGISRQAVAKVTTKWAAAAAASDPDVPVPQRLDMGPIWSVEDVARWEQLLRDAGLHAPGDRPRGPRPSRDRR